MSQKNTRKKRSKINLIIPLFVMGLFALTAVPNAFAHLVELLASTPVNGEIMAESPPVVEAYFNEEMQTGASTIQVFDAQGNQVDTGDGHVNLDDPNHASMMASLPPLPEGAYIVRWHVVLLDSDPTDGAFNFFIGDEAAAQAANFAPMVETVQAETAVPAGPNNTLWLIAGIVVTALIILVPVGLFFKKNAQ